MKTEENKENVLWTEKQKYSNVWLMILRRAHLAVIESRPLEWEQCISTLIDSLFRVDREKVEKYMEELRRKDYTRQYKLRLVQRFIVDLLEEKGYLKYHGTSDLEKGDESIDDE